MCRKGRGGKGSDVEEPSFDDQFHVKQTTLSVDALFFALALNSRRWQPVISVNFTMMISLSKKERFCVSDTVKD